MAKTIAELIEEQKAFEGFKQKGLPLADSSSTRAPSEVSTAGVLEPIDEEDGKYLRLAESIGGEIGGSVALQSVTTPLLGGGLPGIGAYIAINGLGNLGINYWAQSHRDPEAEYSPEEGIATTAIGTLGPLAAYKKVAQLSRLKQTGVAAAEGTAMAFTEDLLRQGLEVATGKRTDGISVQQLGFSGAAGLLFGGGTKYLTSGQNFHKLGSSASDMDKMKKVAEVNAAKRISSIDSMLENPEVTGEYRDLLLREKREIKETLETIRVGDKEYLDGLKEEAIKQEQETRQAIVDRIRKLEEPQVGEGTVLRPKEEIEAPTAEKSVEPEIAPQPTQPTKLTTEQKLEALERMGMSDEDLSKVLEGKSEIIPLNLATFTTDQGIQKSVVGVLEQLSDKIKTSRVKTDKESLIKQVTALRKKLDPELDEARFVQQIAKESEDIIFKTALADSMTFSAMEDWFKKVEANTDLNDPAVATRLMADMDRLQIFLEESARISSSAGKLLQSRKIAKDQIAANINTFERKATKAEKDLVEELIKYPEELSPGELKEQLEKLGGLKNVKALLNEIRLVKDPQKLGKLLEISKRSIGEKFGRVGKELVYDGVLSAPPTQAAAAAGNAMMTLYSLMNQGVGGLATGNLEQTRMALRTTKYLLYGIDDAFQAAKVAAANSQGSMSLNNHYEKIGEKAFTMEATGLSGPIGETVENTGELLSFGPKGLVFQDEFYRHLFGKAQARALLAEEYKQLVKRGEAPVGQIKDYMESRLARYFVDGKRFKTKNDVEMDAVSKAREQGLNVEEAKEFITEYVRDNWTNKLSSEIEYMKDFGDKITFQRELSSDYGVLEAGATKLGELRQKSSVLELVQLFLRTPLTCLWN